MSLANQLFRTNLPLFSTVLPSNIGAKNMIFKNIDNLASQAKMYTKLLDGRTVENKGKLILTEIFPSVQKHDI